MPPFTVLLLKVGLAVTWMGDLYVAAGSDGAELVGQ